MNNLRTSPTPSQEKRNLKTIRVVSKPNLYLMKTMDVSAIEEVVEKLKALPEVFHAEPNFRAEKHSEQPQSD